MQAILMHVNSLRFTELSIANLPLRLDFRSQVRTRKQFVLSAPGGQAYVPIAHCLCLRKLLNSLRSAPYRLAKEKSEPGSATADTRIDTR
jgi:hypothetical protein